MEENKVNEIQKRQYQTVFEELKKLVKGFSSAPFLFIGAGFSRRYMNTPSWEELLTYCSGITREDAPNISFKFYEMNASYSKEEDRLPAIASEIKKDFDKKWLGDKNFRQNHPIDDNESDPFHAFVSQYIGTFEWDKNTYKNEIDNFKNVCGSSIAGIITTNYDCLLDKFSNFTVYVGQSELLVSDPQELAEIYKIHGCITKPNSIILTKEDYDEYRKKTQYLSAKLITIFMEHPIIFLGYSLKDSDILELIKTITGCFDSKDEQKLKKFQNRLFFVDYKPDEVPAISEYGIKYDNYDLLITKRIQVSDFDIIYRSLLNYRQKISVKTLRVFKKGFVEFTKTNKPNEYIQLMDIDNDRLNGKDLALYFGLKNQIQGLVGKTISELFLDILYDNFGYTPDEILYTFIPSKISSNPGLPVCKYIALSKRNSILPEKIKPPKDINSFLSETVKNRKKTIREERSFMEIFNDYSDNLSKATSHMLYIPEEKMTVESLKEVLFAIFNKKPHLLDSKEKNLVGAKANVKKLIRILDFQLYKERAMERLESIDQSTP